MTNRLFLLTLLGLMLAGNVRLASAAAEATSRPATRPAEARLDPAENRVEEWKSVLDSALPAGQSVARQHHLWQSTLTAEMTYGFLGIGYKGDPTPVVIRDVLPGGSAEKAGVNVNDQILALGNLEVPNAAVIQEFVRAHKPGDEVKLVVGRMGVPIELHVRLMSVYEMDLLMLRSVRGTGYNSGR